MRRLGPIVTRADIPAVRPWLADPSSNFGWALVVDAPSTGSAKRFNSRENANESSRPKLTIHYEAGAQAPNARLSLTPTYPRPGGQVQFRDDSTGEPTSWLWDFGDGQTSQEQNPSHTYSTTGSVTVTLTVSNDSGSDSIVKTIRVGSAVLRSSGRQTSGD